MKQIVYKIKTTFDNSEKLIETESSNIRRFNLSKEDLTKLSLKETVSIKTPLIETNYVDKIPNDKKYKKGDSVKFDHTKDITFYVLDVTDEHVLITFEIIKDSTYVLYEISYHEEIEMPHIDLSYMQRQNMVQENYENPAIKYIFDNKDELI